MKNAFVASFRFVSGTVRQRMARNAARCHRRPIAEPLERRVFAWNMLLSAVADDFLNNEHDDDSSGFTPVTSGGVSASTTGVDSTAGLDGDSMSATASLNGIGEGHSSVSEGIESALGVSASVSGGVLAEDPEENVLGLSSASAYLVKDAETGFGAGSGIASSSGPAGASAGGGSSPAQGDGLPGEFSAHAFGPGNASGSGSLLVESDTLTASAAGSISGQGGGSGSAVARREGVADASATGNAMSDAETGSADTLASAILAESGAGVSGSISTSGSASASANGYVGGVAEIENSLATGEDHSSAGDVSGSVSIDDPEFAGSSAGTLLQQVNVAGVDTAVSDITGDRDAYNPMSELGTTLHGDINISGGTDASSPWRNSTSSSGGGG